MRESAESQAELDALLLGCFTVQKLYGRDPGSLESINHVFHHLLGDYPAEGVVRAFEVWARRSPEFPTPADIVGIIRRNGRPPPDKSIYIRIGKKDPELRTGDDWAYLREYEAEANADEYTPLRRDEAKESSLVRDNEYLRRRLADAREENLRLAALLREARAEVPITPPPVPLAEKVARTAAVMRESGASEEDINAFEAQYA